LLWSPEWLVLRVAVPDNRVHANRHNMTTPLLTEGDLDRGHPPDLTSPHWRCGIIDPATGAAALTEGDVTVLDDRIQRLAGGSVITHTAGRSALRMHRLVARVIRDRHRAEGTYPDLISATATMRDTAVFP